MNDNLVMITCDRCQTRLKVKPGLLKVMKSIKCSKCGHLIPVSNITPIVVEQPSQQEVEGLTPTLPPPQAEPVTPPPPPPSPGPITSSAKPVEPATVADPQNGAVPASLRAKLQALEQENESLRVKLRAAELELAESDARISSLQELWHSKEVEVREMSDRLHKAETEARLSLTVREEFLAQVKNELAIYLVRERDSALSRFSDLEKKLLTINPSTT